MTGAQLANALNEAAIIAGRAERKATAREDLDEALLRQSVGSQQARRLNQKERRIVAYHEAGHALCRRLLGLDPPEILSIVPRGPALGFVGHSPQEDTYLKSRDELLDEVVTLLGGRAAEEEVFGNSYSGAVDDLARVHAVCKQMVGRIRHGRRDRRRRGAADRAADRRLRALRPDPPRRRPGGDDPRARSPPARPRAAGEQPRMPRQPRRQRARARDADPRGPRRDLRRPRAARPPSRSGMLDRAVAALSSEAPEPS